MTGQFQKDSPFSYAFENYTDTVYRVAVHNTRDARDAEDVTQEVFEKLLTCRKPFRDEEHLKAWLIRVTVNGCKSRLRAPWRRRTAPLLETYPAATREEGETLEAVLALPPRERAAVHLFYYEGYRTAEIAAMTGEAEGTVRARLSRARKKLKHLLEDETP